MLCEAIEASEGGRRHTGCGLWAVGSGSGCWLGPVCLYIVVLIISVCIYNGCGGIQRKKCGTGSWYMQFLCVEIRQRRKMRKW